MSITEFESNTKQSKAMRNRKGALNPLLPAVLAVGTLAAIGVAPRLENFSQLNKIHETLKKAPPVVNVVTAKLAPAGETLTLPGDLQPIQNIPIYARANGYIMKRFVDIGDKVKEGQVLATIDTPELDQQVQQAIAGLRSAQANLASALSDRENYASQLFAADATIKQNRTNLEYSTSEVKRYQALAVEGAVSYEQRDSKLRQYNSDTANIELSEHNRQAQLAQVASANARIAAAKQQVIAAQAGMDQLKALQGFQKVVAPSDGVITNRLVDAGALVAAGGSNGTTLLLTMAKTDTLRIYVDVPQSDYRFIHDGDHAQLNLQEFPGRPFDGTVTNIAGSLDSASRTLQTEIRIDNHNHLLKPGSYADVVFHFNNTHPAVMIPSSASITRNDGLYVAVVNNKKIEYKPIQVARDFGNKLAVSQGLTANETVVIDAPDGLASGAQVTARPAQSFQK